MRVIEQSFEEIKTDNLFKKVELCGRVCYKSENLITDSSAEIFTQSIIKRNHGAVLEHFVFVLSVPMSLYEAIKAKNYPFFNLSEISFPIVSFNLRAILAQYMDNHHKPTLEPIFAYLATLYPTIFTTPYNGVDLTDIKLLKDEDIRYLTVDERQIHQYVTIKVTTDRGVTHELVRHRLCSFAQESTRYCNYQKEKFNSEITFIHPSSIDKESGVIWEKAMKDSEKAYFKILELSNSPQLARSVLPNSLKTELVISANIKEWNLIFDLRTAPSAHPDVQVLMKMVKDYFIMENYL